MCRSTSVIYFRPEPISRGWGIIDKGKDIILIYIIVNLWNGYFLVVQSVLPGDSSGTYVKLVSGQSDVTLPFLLNSVHWRG